MPAVFLSQQGPLGSHTACYETRPSKTENLTGKSLRFVCDRRAHSDCRSRSVSDAASRRITTITLDHS